jgi:hypothetical protein
MNYIVRANPNLQTIDEFHLPREVNLTIEIPEIDSRIFGVINYTIAQQIEYIENGAKEWQPAKENAIASLKEIQTLVHEIFDKCYKQYCENQRSEYLNSLNK